MHQLPFTNIVQNPMEPAIPIEKISCVKFHDELLSAIKDVLQSHDAKLEIKPSSCIIHFPPGTAKFRMMPVTGSERYQIVFPDGYILAECEAINDNGLSYVSFKSLEDFPVWIQMKYRKST